MPTADAIIQSCVSFQPGKLGDIVSNFDMRRNHDVYCVGNVDYLFGVVVLNFIFVFLETTKLTFQETAAGRKAAHREGKLRMKQEKLQRENACKKASVGCL